MRLPAFLRLGVIGKVVIVTGLLLVAVGGLAVLTVQTTRSATSGADVIDQEFAENVRTNDARVLAIENSDLAAERLRAQDAGQARELDRELAVTGEALARAIGPALDGGNGVKATEADVVRRIQTSYAAYVRVRDAILGQAAGRALPRKGRPALDAELDRVVVPLRRDLSDYGAIHFEEGGQALDTLRGTGRGRYVLLALLLGFALVTVVATVWMARRIVARLREYADFSRVIAGGDLGARLRPRGRDELATLAASLNSMVDQLATSSTRRRTFQEEEDAYRASQAAFSEILQVTESEREAHDILKAHIERGVPGSDVAVLNRNNSQDRLEPTTDVAEGSRLVESLQSAKPRSCLAVRLARPFESGATIPSLLECEVCGAGATDSTCLPLLVSGEVIGSVLVDHDGPLEARYERRLHESVAQAAPILANLRNLAIAEARASTDALTGLPNRRAIQDTLNRMVAQSARTALPLAAVMIDLDHFKKINDTFGHEEGDAVLAAVGVVLQSAMRASDFVGRNGGEEFIVLLPDTDADAALGVAEKLRASIATIKLPRVERVITASLGVAVHPDMAVEAETLLRLADRALYAAKAAGRNRVELSGPSPAPSAHNGTVRVAAVT